MRGLRIGIIRHFHELDHPVSPATLKGIEDAAAFFRSEGATLRDVALPSLAEFNACGWIILLTEAFAVHEAWMRRDPICMASCCATGWSWAGCSPALTIWRRRRSGGR
ncbi:hypothetical protein ACFQU2_02290 [Siccirubricoccus deserti]